MAEYVASNAVESVKNQAKEYASPYLRYFFCYGEIVEDFKNQRKELKLRKQRVKTRVDEAKRQIKVIYEDVEDWLRRAEKELEETQNFEEEIDGVKRFKWCPQWSWRYRLSKKLAEKTLIISKLLETVEIGQPCCCYMFCLKCMQLDDMLQHVLIDIISLCATWSSRRSVEIGQPCCCYMFCLKCMQLDDMLQHVLIDIISLCAKTSNFPQLGYCGSLQGIEFITSTDFMDSESSKSALNQIMEAINSVNMIGLHGMPGVGKTTLAKEVGKHAREKKLFDKVVMFTMSQNPNIKKIQEKVADIFGLHFETSSQEGKAEELFRSMQGVKKILVIVDDLWEEFKLESIGIPFGDEHKGCKILLTTRHQQVCTKMNSKEVAGECKGLPLAIVTVAKALKGESLDGWRAVNQRFKDSRHLDNEEVLGGALKPLKLSYDYLKEGLFPNAFSIEDKRNEIGMALKKLQKSGLLLETDVAETIRMHDGVRDFAHWLTSTGENRFMVKDKLKEWPHMVGCYTAIALWNCSSNIKNFPDKVEFSKLKTLFLKGGAGDDLLVVPNTFFEEMKALRVLLLENVFPLKGFHSLPNLKTLCCIRCNLENFSSSLTNMRSLEILALFETKFDEISEELVKLPALKLLFVAVEEEEEINFPPNLLSRLTSLEEIHLKLGNVSGQKNIVPSIGKMGVNELTSLELESCKDMEFLTDITRDQGPTVAFSNLVE
ncbi:probable disease resistance protein At4g27220 [Gossypium raimondii]|uniref:probable disease resistance protein At4g27220 n=1 Tax=Gossypium raimondii TaxID=29730 RepID=UPI00227C48A6|nr:probable disease resistance protein At4g27220 [Gossypium raimondii]